MDKFLQYLMSFFLFLAALPNHPVIFWIFSQTLLVLGRQLQHLLLRVLLLLLLLEALRGEVGKSHYQHPFLQSPSSCLAELKSASLLAQDVPNSLPGFC